jgi:two-component system response regulator HupR/HoxA
MDIPVLANAFLKQCEADFGKSLAGFSQATLGTLEAYDWPGNVRELHNEIKHMVVMAKAGAPIDPERALTAPWPGKMWRRGRPRNA